MQETGNNHKLCVRVGLRGFTYGIDGCAQSLWLGADCISSVPVLKKHFKTVEISTYTPKFTLVPQCCFEEDKARDILAQTITLEDGEEVSDIAIPEYAAVGVFAYLADDSLSPAISEILASKDNAPDRVLPEQYCQIMQLDRIKAYNKIIVSHCDGRVYLTIAQGRNLLLSANYSAPDFTSAEYYIFYALKRLQLNPEISTVYFRTPLSPDEEQSLYSYFKSVGSL